MLQPKVTTAIPVYNGANYLGQAIESALGQTYGNMEVIVVNDGSTDGGATDAVARSYGDRIRYIIQENQGVGGAMNTAVAHMTGDVFTWLSHDDIHLPEKTAAQIEYQQGLCKKDAILFSDFYLINEQGEIWHETNLPFEQYLKTPMLPLHTGAVNGCTLFMPAHILRDFGPFDASLRHVQDYELWNKILSRHEFFLQQKTLVKYRVHPGQDTHKPDAAIEGDALWIRMLESRSEAERVHLFGSRKKFYTAMAQFLDLTPYKGAAAYAHTQVDAALSETLVSVIVPFFNDVDRVLRAANSVLTQSHANVELILVDDGSTQDTAPIQDLRRSDKRVQLVRQTRVGTSAARNVGLDRAAGHYIAFLNADDVFRLDKIERQMAAMQEAGSVFSHTSYEVSSPSQLEAVRKVAAGTFTGAVFPGIIGLGRRCPINVSTVMIHRSLVAGGFRFDRAAGDVLAWIVAAQRHELLGLDEPLSTIEPSGRRASAGEDELLEDAAFGSDDLRADPVRSKRQVDIRHIEDVRSSIARITEPVRPIDGSGQDLGPDAEVRRLFDEGEFARAAIVAKRATPLAYAHALRNVRDFEGALQVFASVYRKSPSREAHEDLIISLILAGRHAQADAEVAAYLNRHAGGDRFWFHLASCLAYVGRFHEADQIFTRDIELPLPNGLTASTAVCRFTAATGVEAPVQPAFVRSRAVTFDEDGPAAEPGHRAILFLSGDSIYLKRYLEPAIRSFELRSGLSAAVHVHAVDPDESALSLVQSLRASCTVPIGLSWETFDRELVGPGELRSFFSVARFLVLPEILSRYQRTVLMTDLDQVVVRDLSSVLRDAEAHDAALIQNPLNFANVMNLFSASALFVSWTEQGEAFAEKVRAYLLDRISALGGRLPWHLDQTALAYAQLTSRDLRWHAIPPAALQSDPSSAETSYAPRSTTLFWSVTASDDANRSKELNPIFQELVRTAQRPKILFVCFSYSIHAAHWISQVDRADFDVHVFPSNLGNELHHDFADISFWALPGRPTSNNGKGVRLRSFPDDDDAGVADRAELARRLAKVIDSESYSFVHTMEFQHSAYTMLDALQTIQKPLPTWIATNYGADIMLFGTVPEHQQRIRDVLARCDYYWSECARDVDLARRMGFARKALPVLPNSGGIDIEKTAGLQSGVAPSKRKVIAVKGYQHFAGRALTALEALERCHGDLRDYAIVVYATFPEVSAAAERLKQMHDLDVTCFPEWVQHEEILKLHASARISIAISIADGISTSLLEAMAMGSFPIQTATACAGEWIESGRTGFIVEPDDVEGLVASIRRALADDQLVDTAARVNRTRIESQADSRWVAQRVKAIYAEVLRESVS